MYTHMSPEHQITVYIWRVFSPILIVFGTVGNLMTIIVLIQRRNRNSSVARYPTALAVSDISMLWTVIPRNMFLYGYGIDLRANSLIYCKLQFYFVVLFSNCSAWLVVVLTIERCIGTWLPGKSKIICSTGKTNVVIVSLLLVIALLNVHFLFGMGNKDANQCYPMNDGYAYFLLHVWPVILLFGFYLIPLTIMIAVNISIVIRLWISRRKTRMQVMPYTLSSATRAKNAKFHQVTVTLITVSVVYMICVIPILVFLLVDTHYAFEDGGKAHSHTVSEVMLALLNVLFYTNYAVNFILYFLSGSKFRREVRRIFCQRINFCIVYCPCNIQKLEAVTTDRVAGINPGQQNSRVLDA